MLPFVMPFLQSASGMSPDWSIFDQSRGNKTNIPTAMHGYEPVGKSLVAMCSQNMVRMYSQSNDGDIGVYICGFAGRPCP